MPDVVQVAVKYRRKLETEIAKVDEFLRMAEVFSNESELGLSVSSSAGEAPNVKSDRAAATNAGVNTSPSTVANVFARPADSGALRKDHSAIGAANS